MPTAINLTNQRFGRLITISRSANNKGRTAYSCLCDCGKSVIVQTALLRSGKTKSCGCLRVEKTKASFMTHGKSGTREFRIWADMRRRCNDVSNKNYADYGGRGIKVCKRWEDSFENFLSDMGEANGLTIERKNNDGDYEPSNCSWVSRKDQSRNRGSSHFIEFSGEKHCLSAWAEKVGLKRDTLKRRLYLGWSVERAFTEGVRT